MILDIKRTLLTAILFAVLTSTATAATLTKAAYIKRGDLFCSRADVTLDPLLVKINILQKDKPNNLKALQTVLKDMERVADINLAGYRTLMALPKPSGERATLDRLWSVKRNVGVDIGDIVAATRRGNGDLVYTDELHLGAAESAYHKQAVAYGFKVCGS